jgi:DNA polymerase-3 subunit epsilon
MGLDRATWTQHAEAAGLVVGPNVTKKTQLVVAADSDTFSGKAKKARLYGVPVVSEAAFAEALGSLLGQWPRSSSACLSR